MTPLERVCSDIMIDTVEKKKLKQGITASETSKQMKMAGDVTKQELKTILSIIKLGIRRLEQEEGKKNKQVRMI